MDVPCFPHVFPMVVPHVFQMFVPPTKIGGAHQAQFHGREARLDFGQGQFRELHLERWGVWNLFFAGWWLGHPSEEYDFVNWDD